MQPGEKGEGESTPLPQDRNLAKVDGVSVFLYGHLPRYSGGRVGPIMTSVQPGERLRDIIERLKIPHGEIGMTAINGCLTSTLDDPVRPGDEVKLFGLVAGG